MKTLHLSIITGVGIVTVIAVLLSVATNTSLFQSGNIKIEKIQRLADYYTILHIFNPNMTGNDADTSTGGFDWSHDGKFAVFRMGAGAPISYLWSISSDGKEIKQLKIPIDFNYIDNIHVSPDDNSIFFVGQWNDNNITYQDIFRYNLNDNTYSLVTKDNSVRAFDFMPDGNIVFVESHYNSTRLEKDRPIFLERHYNLLWFANPDGKKIQPLYNGTALFSDMSVSPDGNKILFESSEDPNHPSDNGTVIRDARIWGGPPRVMPSYLISFDIPTKKFTILANATDQAYWSAKWLSGNTMIYQITLHQCIQDRTIGVQSCPAGLLSMVNLSNNSTTILYGNQVEPYTAPLFGYAISPDEKSVIFGMNFDFSNGGIDGMGIYLMSFDKPLGEIS